MLNMESCEILHSSMHLVWYKSDMWCKNPLICLILTVDYVVSFAQTQTILVKIYWLRPDIACFGAPLPPVSMLSHFAGSDRPLNQHWHWGGGGYTFWVGEPIFLAKIVWVWRFWSCIYTLISHNVVVTPISILHRELKPVFQIMLHIFPKTSKLISCMSAHMVTLANMVENSSKCDFSFSKSGDLQ